MRERVVVDKEYMLGKRWQLVELGLVDYREAWALQRAILEARIAGDVPDTLLLVEHPPTITLGGGSHPGDLLVSPQTLAEKGIELVRVNRGGSITYHGPGQLVGYPILDLSDMGRDMGRYVYLLEEAIISLLASYRIAAGRRQGYPGVWVDEKKIAALGIYVRRWVTMHGFAINVQPDLGYFSLINPCGLVGCQVTSMAAELGGDLDLKAVQARLVEALEDTFQAKILSEPGSPLISAICDTSAAALSSTKTEPLLWHCLR